MERATTPNATGDEVIDWRRKQMLRAGFLPTLAAEIAEDSRVDLRALIALVENHCPPELAVRILAPLETENAA